MDLKILKRRVEMLDAVSTGLHPSAVIAQLSEKYEVPNMLYGAIGCGGISGFRYC